jgi:hypothetical protein
MGVGMQNGPDKGLVVNNGCGTPGCTMNLAVLRNNGSHTEELFPAQCLELDYLVKIDKVDMEI